MIYYTGDIHGSPWSIVRFCKKFSLTPQDTIITLGDVGANYHGNADDMFCKHNLNHLKPTVLCIHGNHEIRPQNIATYKLKEWCGGSVWYEDEYPHLLFAKDAEIYCIEGLRHLVIGGAYSVDKHFRLSHGCGWWPDEQPSAEVKEAVESKLSDNAFDIILSHTCPYRYEPHEVFLNFIDQNTVDDSTELWLDSIEARANYIAWFCGHWHTDKRIDKMHFLYHKFESSEQFTFSDHGECQ